MQWQHMTKLKRRIDDCVKKISININFEIIPFFSTRFDSIDFIEGDLMLPELHFFMCWQKNILWSEKKNNPDCNIFNDDIWPKKK